MALAAVIFAVTIREHYTYRDKLIRTSNLRPASPNGRPSVNLQQLAIGVLDALANLVKTAACVRDLPLSHR